MPADARPTRVSGAVRTAIDEAALAAWLAANVAGYAGPLTVDQFNGGQSNPTYRLTTPTARYVLRRKPAGPILKGAHDVLREARVLTALGPTDVPVPQVLGICDDPSGAGQRVFRHGNGRWADFLGCHVSPKSPLPNVPPILMR